jgi:hypothetical protein
MSLLYSSNYFRFALCGVVVYVFYFLPEKLFSNPMGSRDLCLLRQLLNIPCPGCGLTRSIYYILHTDVKKGVSMNASGPFLIPVLIIEIISLVTRNKLFIALRYYSHLLFLMILFSFYILKFLT